MGNSIFDLDDKLGYKSPFQNFLSPLKAEVKNIDISLVQVTNLVGPKMVCIGAIYEFKITSFNLPLFNLDLNTLKEKINFGFESENVGISKINKKATLDSINNQLVLKFKIPKIGGSTFFKLYAWTNNPQNAVSLSSNVINYPFHFDRYKLKGLNQNITRLADDLCYGDGVQKTEHFAYKQEQIFELGELIKQNATTDNTAALWEGFENMVTTLFSIGELEKVAIEMINNFKENQGKEFSNAVLNNHVAKNDSTKAFYENIELGIKALLHLSKGDPSILFDDSIYLESDNRFGRPKFSTYSDTFLGGLTICINDTWAYEINITSFDSNDGVNYSIEYTIILYDHFGLDLQDLKVEKYYLLYGFRAWFILQHLRNFKPFVTKIEIKKTMTGNISEKGKLVMKRQKNYS
ncbi:MAG: DUF3289 family protein [Chitinophagales bacterium]|nr:DUF3289 family protein [Chitinophagales bacterium]